LSTAPRLDPAPRESSGPERSMREAWKKSIWIVDGHNAIFAIPALSAQQQAGERLEARRGLERMLSRFAQELAHPLVIVYDGNRLLPNPDARDTRELRTLYSQPPEEADDRIVFLVDEARRRGQSVVVVSNDRRSLAPRLASGVRMMDVTDFQTRCLAPATRIYEPEPSRADYADVERHFLERQEEIERTAKSRARRLEAEARRRWEAQTGSAPEQAAPSPRTARPVHPPVREPAPRAPVPDVALTGDAHAAAESARRQAEQTRARKRSRGERKQARRLEQMRRRPGGGGRREKPR
jgi:predicted RNA-binding protein with PIN domain